MHNECIEGDEWGAYVVLETFLCDGTWDGLQGARESRVQGEVAQVVGWPDAVRYARCGSPKQDWSLVERCSQEATGELIDTERVTISSEGGRWKSTRKGNSLAAYPTARTALTGGLGRRATR